MNVQDVQGKLDVFAGNSRQLDSLRALTAQEFDADLRNLDSALHRLQTSIQALLDIAGYVVGKLELPAPQHSADIILSLRDAGIIPAADTDAYLRMVAFRNRVVHLYNRIDAGLVREILHKHGPDLERMRASLLATIEKHGS